MKIDREKMKQLCEIANTLNEYVVSNRLNFKPSWNIRHAGYGIVYFGIHGIIWNVEHRDCLTPGLIKTLIDLVKNRHAIQFVYWMDFASGKINFVEENYFNRLMEAKEKETKKLETEEKK